MIEKSVFSSVKNNENQTTSLLEQVYKGMTVIDQQGKRLGKVESVKMSDPQAVTTKGEELEHSGPIEHVVSSIFGIDGSYPKSVRDHLLLSGYIKIGANKLHIKDRYVPANEIASVSNDTVVVKN